MRIKTLSPSVANQIAAGEVIENPSSVVKELLENAFDAKASVINIEIGFGGLNQIKISDNGVGIVKEDLPLAIAPHATSKLCTLGDLMSLTSMGFRGEALASIASVSRITLASKPATQETAMMLESNDEKYQIFACARSQGTTIDVRDLFYNAPVRRRFLRSERSEYLAIEQVVKRFALSVPGITIHLKHNGKSMLDLPAATSETTQQLRIQRIFGKAFIENACYLEVENESIRFTGWVSGAAYHRSQNDKQWFYLNQRMLKDKLILHAFKQAYEDLLYPGRHPACVLYLTMNPAEVDINVHPTKHEVRFQQPRLVHDFIHQNIRKALRAEPSSKGLESISVQTETETTPPQTKILRETFTAHPKPAFPSGHMTQATYVALNPKFGLIRWKTEAYLFNVEMANKERVLFQLQNPKPLPSRPLLVPVRLEMNEANLHSMAQWKTLLEEYGIQLEMHPSYILIRTLPLALPQLDLHTFMSLLINTTPNQHNLFQILSKCLHVEEHHLEEKNQLSDFIIQQLEQDKTVAQWCVPLTIERCEAWLNG